MKKELPVYKMIIDENIDEATGVSVISFVDEPAIELDWVTFSKETVQFEIQDEEKRIVMGAILVPDKKIYRNDENGEYYLYVTKEVIQQIVFKFFKTNKISNVDIDHNGLLMNGVTMFESFIVDSTRGINAPQAFKSVPDGTWFGSFHVQNDELWSQVKNGEVNGFSIAGLFSYIKVSFNKDKQKTDLEIYQELSNLFQDL